jgi:hypothetical protein
MDLRSKNETPRNERQAKSSNRKNDFIFKPKKNKTSSTDEVFLAILKEQNKPVLNTNTKHETIFCNNGFVLFVHI